MHDSSFSRTAESCICARYCVVYGNVAHSSSGNTSARKKTLVFNVRVMWKILYILIETFSATKMDKFLL